MTRAHGTYAKYKLDHCRCYPCAHTASQYRLNRERAIAYGTWRPYVDATPVRAHVLHLRACGIGERRLAQLADVRRNFLRELTLGKPGRPPSQRVRPDNALRILAIEPTLDNIAASTPVDSAGTRRRLHALIAIGWSQAQLAARLSQTAANFGQMLARTQVTAHKARLVRDLYDQLWDADPAAHGAPACGITRARNLARARGWLPPAAWDDDLIDLPDADLHAELQRRAERMDDAEVARCHRARYRDGDQTPLTKAAATEYERRRRTSRDTARATDQEGTAA